MRCSRWSPCHLRTVGPIWLIYFLFFNNVLNSPIDILEKEKLKNLTGILENSGKLSLATANLKKYVLIQSSCSLISI